MVSQASCFSFMISSIVPPRILHYWQITLKPEAVTFWGDGKSKRKNMNLSEVSGQGDHLMDWTEHCHLSRGLKDGSTCKFCTRNSFAAEACVRHIHCLMPEIPEVILPAWMKELLLPWFILVSDAANQLTHALLSCRCMLQQPSKISTCKFLNNFLQTCPFQLMKSAADVKFFDSRCLQSCKNE